MHYRVMRRLVIGALAGVAALGILACGGLVNDVSKGAGTTDREVNKELGNDRTGRGDAANGGTISM